MSDTLKSRIRADLTTAMKAREADVVRTLRAVVSAVQSAEVAGDEARELSDAEVLDLIVKEAKKRQESLEIYESSDREDLAAGERAELAVLAAYLPAELSEQELTELVTAAIDQTGAAELGPRGMGKVMGVLTPQTKGRADGAKVAAEVKRQLAG